MGGKKGTRSMRNTGTNRTSQPTSGAAKTMQELRGLIGQHRVCWEVLPEQTPVEGQKPLQVGFALMLYGAHAPAAHPSPGCDTCKQIYRDLGKIAQWIMPKEERQSRYEISMYDSAIGYSPVRGNRPDVTVVIKILHRTAFDRPIDECEILCLNEMKATLSDLGAQEKRWRERS